MKRFFLRPLVIFPTFVLGVVLTLIWLHFNPRIQTLDEVVIADLPVTPYCELVKNPRKYDGKIIRLDTTLNWFMHGFFLADSECFGEGDEARTAISFDEQIRKENEKLFDILGKSGEKWKPAKIVVLGRFKYGNTGEYSDSIEDRTALHFEIFKVESASIINEVHD